MASPPAPLDDHGYERSTLTKEVDVMKRIAATIGVAALVVTAGTSSGLIPSGRQ